MSNKDGWQRDGLLWLAGIAIGVWMVLMLLGVWRTP